MDEKHLQHKSPFNVRRAYAAVVLVASAGTAMLVASCAASEQSPLYVADDVAEAGDSGGTPGFTSDAASDAAATDARVAPQLCVGTECPYPYATCGSTETLHCGINLSNDANNCGACGNKCPTFDKFNATSRCVDGACVLECAKRIGGCSEIDYQDCNGFPDDGCESVVSDDPNNCGTCGHVCPAGQACVKGSCGCPAGQTFCPGCSFMHPSQCVNLTNDDLNCGGCNIQCPRTGACAVPPPSTQYGCANGACGALKCATNTADCDDDLNLGCASDGCEVDLSTDPQNCGACGNKCGPGKECRDEGSGPECLDTCEAQGKTVCGSGCVDLLTDPRNCGNCDFSCDTTGNQIAQCVKGTCKPKCEDGFADCDGNPNNGCEVNLTNNQTNCGACGVACDFVQGQPCVEGKCLMVECDGGITTK